jgi:hypothetical protein
MNVAYHPVSWCSYHNHKQWTTGPTYLGWSTWIYDMICLFFLENKNSMWKIKSTLSFISVLKLLCSTNISTALSLSKKTHSKYNTDMKLHKHLDAWTFTGFQVRIFVLLRWTSGFNYKTCARWKEKKWEELDIHTHTHTHMKD